MLIVNIFEIEKMFGKKYGVWGGVINVFLWFKVGCNGVYCDSFLYWLDWLIDLIEVGINFDLEIFLVVIY